MLVSYVHPHHSSYLSGARLAAKAMAPAKSFSFSLSDTSDTVSIFSETGRTTFRLARRMTGPTVAAREVGAKGPKQPAGVLQTGHSQKRSGRIAPVGASTGVRCSIFRLHPNVCRVGMGCQRNGFQGESSIAARAATTPPSL